MNIETDLEITELGDNHFVVKDVSSEEVYHCNGIASLIAFLTGYFTAEDTDLDEEETESDDRPY